MSEFASHSSKSAAAADPIDPQQRKNRVLSGQIPLTAVTVGELFDLARTSVMHSDFSGRDAIYDLIERHPEASDVDRGRVSINRADNVRRQNTESGAREALLLLDKIPNHLGVVAEAERLQVAAQAHLVLYRICSAAGESRKTERIEHQAALLSNARDILEYCASNQMPADKGIFYQSSFASLKFIVGERDQEFRSAVDKWRSLLDAAGADIVSNTARAQAAEIMADFANALNFDDYVRAYQLGTGPYYKMGGAIKALVLTKSGLYDPQSPELVSELTQFVYSSVPQLDERQYAAFAPQLENLRQFFPDLPVLALSF